MKWWNFLTQKNVCQYICSICLEFYLWMQSIYHHNKCLDIVCELPPCSFGCSSSAACGWRPLAPAPGCWGGLSRSRQHPDEWRWGGIMVWMNKSKGRERLCSAFVMIPPPTINVVVWEKNRAMKSVRIWEKIVWGSDKEPGIPSCGGFQGQPLYRLWM